MEKEKTEWFIRDHLAAERTDLAIDRTLLAYIRTAMTIIVVGISFIKLFNENLIHFIGFFLVFFASGLIVVGFIRAKKQKKNIRIKF